MPASRAYVCHASWHSAPPAARVCLQTSQCKQVRSWCQAHVLDHLRQRGADPTPPARRNPQQPALPVLSGLRVQTGSP